MENSTYYSCQIRLYVLPYSGSYTIGTVTATNTTNFIFPTLSPVMSATNTRCTTVIIPSTNNIGTLLGFYPGVIGTGSFNYDPKFEDKLSNFSPEIDPIASVLITCSMANNEYSSPNNLIDTFSYGDVDYGMMIKFEPNNLNWIKVYDTAYSEFIVEFKTPTYREMYIKDPNSILTFVIDEPDE